MQQKEKTDKKQKKNDSPLTRYFKLTFLSKIVVFTNKNKFWRGFNLVEM